MLLLLLLLAYDAQTTQETCGFADISIDVIIYLMYISDVDT